MTTIAVPGPDTPVTITIPYWVANQIRTTMHRNALEPEGCMCIEHAETTLTKPNTAYDITKTQIDHWYQNWKNQ